MAKGLIRYWAAARAAAGVAEEPYDAGTLGEALATAAAHRGEEFARVLARSSFLVDEAPVGVRDPESVRLPEGGTVEVLPPFAGGAGDGRRGRPHSTERPDAGGPQHGR